LLGNPARRLDFFVDGIPRAVQPEPGKYDEQAGRQRGEDDTDAGVQAEFCIPIAQGDFLRGAVNRNKGPEMKCHLPPNT
jgi:hypothetical protein